MRCDEYELVKVNLNTTLYLFIMMSGYELTELSKDRVLMSSDKVLTESVAYDIAFGTAYPPKFGFIIVRHVNSKQTDYYWKECYTCIRKWYTDPILIVDDSSHPEFLNDNMNLVNCQIVYDTEHKGCAELLGYYYFELMHPFETAVIIHDSVFIQKRIEFSTVNMKFLWTFTKAWDHELEKHYLELCKDMPDIIRFYREGQWEGCYGLMSVIQWSFVCQLKQYGLFTVLDKLKERDHRSAMERVLGFLAYYVGSVEKSIYGEIHSYTRWGGTFLEYLGSDSDLDVVKVWTGR
jgi:hypothetical protein